MVRGKETYFLRKMCYLLWNPKFWNYGALDKVATLMSPSSSYPHLTTVLHIICVDHTHSFFCAIICTFSLGIKSLQVCRYSYFSWRWTYATVYLWNVLKAILEICKTILKNYNIVEDAESQQIFQIWEKSQKTKILWNYPVCSFIILLEIPAK